MADIKIRSNIAKNLRDLSKQLQDMTPVFKDLADLELSQTKLRFQSQEDPQGKKWPEPNTIRRGTGPETGSGARTKTTSWSPKEAWDYVLASNHHATPPNWRFFDAGKGDKILRDTGLLLKSIGRVYSKSSALVGTNRQYGPKLQEGRFPFLGINKKTEDNVNTVMSLYLKKLGFK